MNSTILVPPAERCAGLSVVMKASLQSSGILCCRILTRTHLKNVFWPNIFVGAAFQILDIQQYASGLKLGPAAILNQNPIFQMGSNKKYK